MKVVLIASTHMWSGNVFMAGIPFRHQVSATDADNLAELAGRNCYQSWDRPNPKTATNSGYLANILAQEHFSVLEHASATFYVEGVSRSFTHELIRHRHFSFSELSQRYVDMADVEYVLPPAVMTSDRNAIWASDDVEAAFDYAKQQYFEVSDKLDALPKKQRREAARAVMPNCTETKIVVSGNLRAWRDMLKKRHHVAADAEIQLFAGKVLSALRELAPNSFQDIPIKPYGSKDA